jgi:hypothetical protein
MVMLLAAGCSQTADDAQPPALAHLTLTPNGLGDLRLGAPVASSDLVNYGRHACPSSGGWLPRYAQSSDTSGGQQLNPFDVDTRAGSRTAAVTAVFVWSRSIRTSQGIHVGSSLADVRAAYPHAKVTVSSASDLYVVKGSRGQLVLEVSRNNEYGRGEWPPNVLGTVVWMDVVAAGSEPEPLAGSNDAGPCPIRGHVPDMDDD